MIEINGFTITKKVGTGGMADVFKAISKKDNRVVAVKILKESVLTESNLVKRFLREGEILSKLNHPNIVKFIESGNVNNSHYIITEFLGDGDILSTVNHSFDYKISVAMDICDALHFAHSKHIVHRDLKPSNILLNSAKTPKITDFGIATLLNSQWTQLTKTDMVIGTIAYMSPEQQFRPNKVDRRTDIFSIGAILYQYFTGREAIGRFPLPTEIIKNFPKELEKIILKCMEYEPEHRFQTAGEIAEALYPFLDANINLPLITIFGEEKETVAVNDDFSERITPCIQALKSKFVQDQLDGEKQLRQNIKQEDIPRLYNILKTENNRVRWVLIDLIGELGDSSAVNQLIPYINIHELTPYVIKALGKLKGQTALNALLHFMPRKTALGGYKETTLTKEFLPQLINAIGEISARVLTKFEKYLLFHKVEKVRETFLLTAYTHNLKLNSQYLNKLEKKEKNKVILSLIKKIRENA